jgi:putative oxidoreductase
VNRLLWQRTDEALLLLRVWFCLMIMVHGWQKLSNFSAWSGGFDDPFGLGSSLSLSLAIFAELGCSVLVLVGLLTRLALVPLLITMLVAVTIHHSADPWGKKELAMTFMGVFATLMLAGPGRYSLDHKLFGPRGSA